MRASISSRFSAMHLDMIIFGSLWQAVSLLIGKVAPELMTPRESLLLCFLTSTLYFIYPTKKSGQTLGKKLLSLKVVPLAGDKVPLSWRQVLLRESVGKLLGGLSLGLGYIWAYTNDEHKAWHDSLSQTHVISLIWENEKTFLQKLQHVLVGILSIPLGLALMLGVFLYTPLPLDSIKEKIEASGIQVGTLSGSLAGGLHFSEIKRQDAEQSFYLGSIDVKCNLSALVYDRVFFIEKLSVEEGHIEVPENFSWATIFMNLLASGQGQGQGQTQDPEQSPGVRLGHFKMGKLHFKNIFFENNKKVLLQLQELTLKNLEMADKELFINEGQFQTEGLTIKTQDFKSSFGRIEVGSVTGGLGPDFLPLLKVPVDFHLKGVIGKNPKATKIEGGMTLDKIKFTYETGSLAVEVDKLLLNEMFKTALPLEELNLKMTSQGEDLVNLLSLLKVEYGIKVCGNEFQPKADEFQPKADEFQLTAVDKNLPVYSREDRRFSFKMTPKPVPDFRRAVFAKGITLDDLFFYDVQGRKLIGNDFASPQEMLADLCYRQNFASLQATQLEVLGPLIKLTEVPPSPVELAHRFVREARSLLRLGKYAEAKALLEKVPLASGELPAQEVGAVYSLRGWVYLYSDQPAEAVQAFEAAFAARKDVGDAEGLVRANEVLKKDQEALKWLEYIKIVLKTYPELKSHLTPNMQTKVESAREPGREHSLLPPADR